jgi:hypothetical protein
MRPRPVATVWLSAAAVLLAVTTTTSAGAATGSSLTTLALWNMTESAGSNVLADSSGNRIDGTIGTEDVLNGSYETFPYLKPNTPPANPQHLDVVTSSLLNPGDLTFSITMRAKWTHDFGNMIQKGQSGVPGGYFKWQAPSGLVQCLFRGSAGDAGVSSKRPLNDGLWHTITCTRTATQVSMTVDGVVTMTLTHATGTISNSWPLTIAGKGSCDQVKVTCDYWVGEIAYVEIQTS